ncbi:MAG: recombination protein NinB [Ferribacterium limneticum]
MAEMLRTFILRDDMNAAALWSFLKNNWKPMATDGKPLAVTVTPHKTKRSSDQNKRYWAILNEIAGNAWINGQQFSSEAWAEFFKGKFIGFEETPDGRRIGISTTTLDVAEFTEYMTRIEVYAASELGIEVI